MAKPVKNVPNNGVPFRDDKGESSIINGSVGDDIIAGTGGDDEIFGGNGNDILLGNTGNDILNGGNGNDILFGGQGDDILFGGQGRDWLSGDLGNDILTGGGQADTFSFNVSARILGNSLDTVTDFEVGRDTLEIRNGDIDNVTVAANGDDLDVFYDGIQIAILQNVTTTDIGELFL